jgi:uncharacterized protein YcbX
MIRVSQLFIYPIKSCRGIRVDSARVVERGFEMDRRWMVIDEQGSFLTQRELPRLALVRTELDQDAILLSGPGKDRFRLTEPSEAAPEIQVQVWSHHGGGAVSEEASSWISRFLLRPALLVYMRDSHRRPVSPKYAEAGHIVSFAHGSPFLLTSEASLADLNARLDQPLAMERFRPNIVVAGAPAYAEDGWSHLRIGTIGFRVVKPCDRCATTTVDPDTGQRGQEPLRTLAQYRRQGSRVLFGMNLIQDGLGTIRVGDRVTVSSV